jgi:hypothetical protein
MVTKRQLGIIVVVLALLGVIGLIGVDLVGAGEWSGFGPLQRIGIGLGSVAMVVGVILILLGNRPA